MPAPGHSPAPCSPGITTELKLASYLGCCFRINLSLYRITAWAVMHFNLTAWIFFTNLNISKISQVSNHIYFKYPLKPLRHFSLYWWSKHHIWRQQYRGFTVSFTLDVSWLQSWFLEAIKQLSEAPGNPFSFSVWAEDWLPSNTLTCSQTVPPTHKCHRTPVITLS